MVHILYRHIDVFILVIYLLVHIHYYIIWKLYVLTLVHGAGQALAAISTGTGPPSNYYGEMAAGTLFLISWIRGLLSSLPTRCRGYMR
nr:hypothetical protein Q903MT_gene3449 [Picea sitchensis]